MLSEPTFRLLDFFPHGFPLPPPCLSPCLPPVLLPVNAPRPSYLAAPSPTRTPPQGSGLPRLSASRPPDPS